MRLFFIILAQFLSGSIWFAGNIAYSGQGQILSAVQLGFIAGSLAFAFFNISDRFSPVRVFFFSALFGALFNYSGIYFSTRLPFLLLSRLCCGICLAGIYPVGMKVAAAWYPKTIARALGWMVGALVLATGTPHLIKALHWQGDPGLILKTTSVLCLSGGLIQLFLVKDGPHLPRASEFNLSVTYEIFRHPGFKASSFGYFGHMWELYALFAFIPLLIEQIVNQHAGLWTFGFFGFGFLGCALGGLTALKTGSRNVALTALFFSGAICLTSPLLTILPKGISLAIIMLWGSMVAADSPQFSSLNTQFAPKEYVGSALTIVNCIGFAITIVTIELTGFWIDSFGIQTAFLPLALGPAFGWISLKKHSP